MHFRSKIILVKSNDSAAQVDFDFRSNYTPLSSITVIN